MDVTVTIDGEVFTLSDEERWALRQACGSEQHGYLKRRDNSRTTHLREQYMRQALFLERIANRLINR